VITLLLAIPIIAPDLYFMNFIDNFTVEYQCFRYLSTYIGSISSANASGNSQLIEKFPTELEKD
jgi:hypothetical protein